MSSKAAYRGHCQVCNRIQKLPGCVLAKHGYQVMDGWFNGVCRCGYAMIGKHPYNPECVCKRCLAEFTRRGLQSIKTEKNRRKTARRRERNASREEQNARLLDCGPQAWDDRD